MFPPEAVRPAKGAAWGIERRSNPASFSYTPEPVRTPFQKVLQPPPDGFNVGLNDDSAAGQTVPQLHVRVIPR